ncbi:MAG: hypothetical protein K2X08_03040, partial [Chlamydiales bacterium]|nr:hypothetical protein [Chlamydiales bacterium]
VNEDVRESYQDGDQYYPRPKGIFTVDDSGPWKEMGGMVYQSGQQIGVVQKEFNRGLARLELLFQKFDELINFLNAPQQSYEAAAKFVFHNCLALLQSLQQKRLSRELDYLKKEGSPNINSSGYFGISPIANGSPISTNNEIVFGPFWNTAIASEDSLFTWTVTYEDNGKVSLESSKRSTGRGMIGGTATRKVLMSIEKEDQIEICITKEHFDDGGDSSSRSKYILTKGSDGGVIVAPEGKSDRFQFYSFFLGDEGNGGSSYYLQNREQMKEDAQFMMEILKTVSDLSSHPETMLLSQVPEKREDGQPISFSVPCVFKEGIFNSEGRIFVPPERLAVLVERRQGLVVGIPPREFSSYLAYLKHQKSPSLSVT